MALSPLGSLFLRGPAELRWFREIEDRSGSTFEGKNMQPNRIADVEKSAVSTVGDLAQPLTISVQETQRHLGGLSRAAIDRLLRRGLIQSFRLGRLRRVVLRSLVEFIEQQVAAK
jgi:hypothetical protein